jgi:MFS family permease
MLSAVAYGVTSWTPTFLSRVLELQIPPIAFTLGVVQLITGVIGYLASGTLVDWMTARRIPNASHRYLSCVAIVASLSCLCAFIFTRELVPVMFWLGVFNLAIPFSAALVASLQIGTPRAYRGRAIGLSLMLVTPLGLIVGPSGMALVTEHVFGDPKMVGHSVATVSVICCAIAIASFTLSYRAAKRTIAETQELEAAEARASIAA